MKKTDASAIEQPRPLLGIGSCLAGNAVRYNGQTKKPNSHVVALTEQFETRAFCPEMGAGMGVPRPPIHLVGDEHNVRAVDVDTHSKDFTAPIRAYADTVLKLAPEICGYILVKGSPSCGYGRVKRYSEKGHSVASDQNGIFANALHAADPLLPLEDDGRLNDERLRESFATRACTYHDWKQTVATNVSARALIEFYTRYKYLVMAHHVPSYQRLGKMLANAGKENIEQLSAEFIETLMAALTHTTTRASHGNTLFHISGYLKRDLTPEQRQRLRDLIESYRKGEVPLVVPVTMLKHYFADSPDAYINSQVFLNPYPDELRLRNLV
ncbi:MAG: YbgA family protein [Halioglobus sp.]